MANKKKSTSQPKGSVKSIAAAKGAAVLIEVDTLHWLRTWNLAAAGLHALQGLALLVLSTSMSYPVVSSYVARDPLQSAAQGKTVLTLASQHLFDLNMAYILAGCFFIAAIAHGVTATVYRTRYEAGLRQGVNKIRWIQYALSGGLMMVAIGLLAGAQELSVLLALFGFTAILSLGGLLMEARRTSGWPVRPAGWVAGVLTGLLPWTIIATYLLASWVYSGSAPAFVYWIFGSVLVLFAAIAANAWLLQRGTQKWADYAYGERIYIVLSLVVASLLAWQVFAGVLHP